MLVQPEDETARPDWPGRFVLVGGVAWIEIDELQDVRALRLRRADLKKPDRQQDVERHLQEFAFPVLERCLTEMTRSQVLGQRDGRLSMVPLLLVVAVPAGPGLPGHGEDEQCEEDDGESVVVPDPAEPASRLRKPAADPAGDGPPDRKGLRHRRVPHQACNATKWMTRSSNAVIFLSVSPTSSSVGGSRRATLSCPRSWTCVRTVP